MPPSTLHGGGVCSDNFTASAREHLERLLARVVGMSERAKPRLTRRRRILRSELFPIKWGGSSAG